MDPHQLAGLAASLPNAGGLTIYESVKAALASALEDADGSAVLCVAGSLFVAAEGREAWLALHPGAFPVGDWVYDAEPMASDWQVSQVLASELPAAGVPHSSQQGSKTRD